MFENRSFDNALGLLYPERTKAGTYDGVEPGRSIPVNPYVAGGERVGVWSGTGGIDTAAMPLPDPNEDFADMSEQIFAPHPVPLMGPGQPTMEGFAWNYAKAGGNPLHIMQCYLPGATGLMPVTTALAAGYAVCDRWFGSGPVQTLANRTFALCATPGRIRDAGGRWVARTDNGDFTGSGWDPDGNVDATTVFEALDRAPDLPGPGKAWKVYYHDWPLSAFIRYVDEHWSTVYGGNVYPFRSHSPIQEADFFYDVAHGELPAFGWIEPRYSNNVPPNLPGNDVANSNHPGRSHIDVEDPNGPASGPPIRVTDGEHLLRTIYKALAANPALFARTLLVVLYDEHGGLYDHVGPPAATSPFGGADPVTGFDYSRFGPRVPALFVNPRIPPGTVYRPGDCDHTTIIRTLFRRFGLQWNGNGWLTPRDRDAPDLGGLVVADAEPRPPLDLPEPAGPDPASWEPPVDRRPDEPGPGSLGRVIHGALQASGNRDRVHWLR